MIWIILAAMTVLVAGAILRPFLGKGPAEAAPAAAYDLGVYRDQLREVERDVKRAVLTPEEAERLKTEIGRKILEADRAMAKHASGNGGGASRPWVAAAVLAVAVAGSAAIYRDLGSPAMPDQPLQARIAAAEARIANLPAQAELETRAPERPTPDAAPDYLQLIEQLRAAVAQNPRDEQGLSLLAEHEGRLGNIAAAREAQATLIEVRGDRADAFDHIRLTLLMVEAAGGMVSAEARDGIVRVLSMDPAQGQARYLQGLMYAQNDRPDLAFAIWRDLLENGHPNAPWNVPIRQLMPELAWFAGHPDYQPPQPAPPASAPGMPSLPGPDADAVAAASEMSPEEQRQMIVGMVRNLEARLADEGGTPEEWARLISSLVRIDEGEHARDILTEARTRFAGNAGAMATIDAAAADVGLPPAAE